MENDVAGWIIIGTDLNTKQLEKKLNEQKRKLQNFEKESEKYTKLKTEAETDLQSYEEEKRMIEKMTDEWLQQAKTQEEANKILDGEKIQIESLNSKYSEQLKTLENINFKLQENAENQNQLKKEIEETTNKLNSAKAKDFFEKQGKSITKTITKIAKWGVALIGIRGAYSAISRAMSTLSGFNEQLKSDLQYIRIALASALEPIVNKIVEWIYKILQYVQYVINAWFGHNIFENANENLKKANRNANKLQKTLAKFDEMNILNDNSSNGTTTPSNNLSEVLKDNEVPKWLENLKKYKDEIEAIAFIIGGIFAVSKINGWLSNLGLLFGSANGTGLIGLLGTLTKIGLIGGAIVITGYIYGKFKQDVKELHDWVIEMNEKGKEFLHNWGQEQTKIEPILNTITAHLETGKEALGNSKNLWYKILGISDDYLINAQTTVETNEDLIRKAYDLYLQDDKNLDKGIEILKIIEDQLAYNQLIKSELEKQGKSTDIIDEKTRNLKKIYGDIYTDVTNTKEGLETMERMNFSDKSFKINGQVNIDTRQAEKDYSNWLTRLGEKFNSLFKGKNIRNLLGNFGINLPFAKGGIVANPIKLASGALINQPNRGVPIGGESGIEGVLPLTDSQRMEMLGASIGKHVTINATIPIYAYNRQVDRQMKKIKAEDDFAYNR